MFRFTIYLVGPKELRNAQTIEAIRTVKKLLQGNVYGIGRLLKRDLWAVIVNPTKKPIKIPNKELLKTRTNAS